MKWLLFLLFITPAHAQYFSAPPVQLPTATVPPAASVMANWNREVSDGNTAYNNFQALITGVVTTTVTSGAILPFNSTVCPSGWVASNGTAGTIDLRGYFPRVLSGSGRTLGNVQTDAIQNHIHTMPSTSVAKGQTTVSNGDYTNSTPLGVGMGSSSGTGGVVSGTSGSETRPKNIALLFCQKS